MNDQGWQSVSYSLVLAYNSTNSGGAIVESYAPAAVTNWQVFVPVVPVFLLYFSLYHLQCKIINHIESRLI